MIFNMFEAKDHRYGLIDHQGNIIIPATYKELLQEENYYYCDAPTTLLWLDIITFSTTYSLKSI